MVLVLFIVFLTQIFSEIRYSVITELAPASEFAHRICLSLLPGNSEFQSELAALVCAQDFTSENQRALYVSSGLIHLFVVSGSHLIVLQSILSTVIGRNYKFQNLILTFLFIYALMCKLSPPVCRSLVGIFLSHSLYSINIRWSSNLCVLLSGLICLCLNFEWCNSISLQLSWIAAICISTFADSNNSNSILLRQSTVFALMYPTISNFQSPSILSILSNIFLAPVLELILFPAALLTAFFNHAYPAFDFIMKAFRIILNFLEFKSQPELSAFSEFQIYINWILILLLHFILHLKAVNKFKLSKTEGAAL